MLSSYVNDNFSENAVFAGETSVFTEISFLILLSSV